MNNKYLLGVIVAILVIAGAGYFVQTSDKKVSNTEHTMMKDDTELMSPQKTEDNNTMMDKNESMDSKSDSMMAKPGAYKDYSPSTVTSEQAAGQKVVLFFHAPWCPYCKAANTAFLNNLSLIPAGVTVLKTDYDSNTDLKKKYGVTYQHTFVQIDNSGNLVTKWNGGDIDALKQNLK